MADLLQSWYDKNAVGSDYLPRLFVQGKTLQNDAARIQMQQQQLQNQYAQFQAESARANQQAEFQDKKFLYAMNQDKMDRTRQGMLDARSGQMQQAQIGNWTADNNRASVAADQNKKFQDAQMANWTAKNKEDAPADFSWVDGSTPTPQASTDAPPDSAPQSSNPIQPYAGSGGSDAGDGLPEMSGQPSSPDASLLPTGNDGAQGETGPVGSSSPADLSSHPGRAKWESVQRAAALTPGLISGMKSADRMAALQALGKVNILKQDPEVVDYQRRLDAQIGQSGNSYKQDQLDQGQELQFQNDAREAARQNKAITRYAGDPNTEMMGAPKSDAMINLQKGLPAADWKTVLAEESAAQSQSQTALRGKLDAEQADWKKSQDTSIAGRATKAATAADVNAVNENKQWNQIKESWAKENPEAMKVITQAAIAGKSGGQAPTQDELLKQLESAVAESGNEKRKSTNWIGYSSSVDWTKDDSKYFHPDPSNRGGSSGNGDPIKNRDMALMIYNQIKSAETPETLGKKKPTTGSEFKALKDGDPFVGPDGKDYIYKTPSTK